MRAIIKIQDATIMVDNLQIAKIIYRTLHDMWPQSKIIVEVYNSDRLLDAAMINRIIQL